MIIAETTITKDNVLKFRNNFVSRTQIFTLIMCLIVIGCGIVEIYYQDTAFGIFCIVFGALFYPLMLVLQRVATVKLLKRMMLNNKIVNRYEFDDSSVHIATYKSDAKVSETTVSYDEIFKCEERDNYYYIFMSKMQAFIVDKKGIIEGTTADLSVLLATVLGNRYIIKISKKNKK